MRVREEIAFSSQPDASASARTRPESSATVQPPRSLYWVLVPSSRLATEVFESPSATIDSSFKK